MCNDPNAPPGDSSSIDNTLYRSSDYERVPGAMLWSPATTKGVRQVVIKVEPPTDAVSTLGGSERMKMRCNPSDEGLTINHPMVNKDFN